MAVEHAALLAEVHRLSRPQGAHDLLIAATARATGRTVVTADLAAYADLPGVATRSLSPNRRRPVEQIGDLLGTSAQAAQQRYGAVIERA